MPKLDLKRAPRTIYVFNSSKEPKVGLDIGGLRPGKYPWEAKDCRMGSASKGEVEVTGDRLTWDAPAPAGGMVELHCP
jgi:hypothetical protein